MNPKTAIKALFFWDYNTSAYEKVESLFPGRAPTYLTEKANVISERGLANYFGTLDDKNQARLIEMAIAFAIEAGFIRHDE